ncbi:MAG TPA: hypothetical protein VK435_02490, partial [Thermodesulfovibrionales bacterium]|nr:hypothetical protein [Thermodesulfovibrionales bacterium]
MVEPFDKKAADRSLLSNFKDAHRCRKIMFDERERYSFLYDFIEISGKKTAITRDKLTSSR